MVDDISCPTCEGTGEDNEGDNCLMCMGLGEVEWFH